jgi:HD-GYP domain-containing protein (c-di-GMP phosphodiesterase class II)
VGLVRLALESGRPERKGRAPDHDGAGESVTAVRLAELMARLSLPFEATADARPGRAVRATVLAVELGRRAGASTEELRDAYWLALVGPRARAERWLRALREAFLGDAEAGAPPPALLGVLERAMFRGCSFAPLEHADVLDDANVFERFLELEPEPVEYADDARLERFALAVALFTDLEQPEFLGHSTRVADLAVKAAGVLQFGPTATTTLRLAGLLHDVGRPSVPSEIWMRPRALDWAERERVQLQSFHTGRVLAPISGLAGVAEVATAVQERRNGSGYPHGRSAPAISLEGRVLAAAHLAVVLAEARPYRAALDTRSIARELVAQAAADHLDPKAVDAVLAALDLPERAKPGSAHGLSGREIEVSRLLALGKSDKEIGAMLHISPRTVQVHVARILEKLGVRSRSGAAVWVIRHDPAS